MHEYILHMSAARREPRAIGRAWPRTRRLDSGCSQQAAPAHLKSTPLLWPQSRQPVDQQRKSPNVNILSALGR